MAKMKVPRVRVKCITLNMDHTYSEEYGEMMLGVIRMKDGTVRSGIGASPTPKEPMWVESLEEIHEIDEEWRKGQPLEYLALFREGDILPIPPGAKERTTEETRAHLLHFWAQVDKLRSIEEDNLRIGMQESNLIRNRILVIVAAIGAITAYVKFLDIIGFF